jgi:phosphoribosyl 1,2-cyclic phosphodiesterase
VVLTFLGTRGYLDVRSRRHARHSALAVAAGRGVLLVDCGEDWLDALPALAPAAILLTHAHPDHAGGLARGAPCPVMAPRHVLEALRSASPIERVAVEARAPRRVCGVTVEAFPVVHSLRAPAVGYRFACGRRRVFYVPDVVSIPDVRAALSGLDLYIGDGAALVRPILRYRDGVPIGHASIRDQLGWCSRNGVQRAVFTHCGSAVVRADPRIVEPRVERMGRELGVEARLAHDGMSMTLARRGGRIGKARSSGRRP